jgi:hypothetical protein
MLIDLKEFPLVYLRADQDSSASTASLCRRLFRSAEKQSEKFAGHVTSGLSISSCLQATQCRTRR